MRPVAPTALATFVQCVRAARMLRAAARSAAADGSSFATDFAALAADLEDLADNAALEAAGRRLGRRMNALTGGNQ